MRTAIAAAGGTVLASGLALADPGGGFGYGHPMMGGGWMVFGTLFSLALILLLVLGAVWLLRGLDVLPGRGRRRREALAILEERFARGEIDLEEFERRKRALEA